MVPVAGGAYLLPSLIGLPAATRMIASGAFIDAEEALRLGMVGEVCADDMPWSPAPTRSPSR